MEQCRHICQWPSQLHRHTYKLSAKVWTGSVISCSVITKICCKTFIRKHNNICVVCAACVCVWLCDTKSLRGHVYMNPIFSTFALVSALLFASILLYAETHAVVVTKRSFKADRSAAHVSGTTLTTLIPQVVRVCVTFGVARCENTEHRKQRRERERISLPHQGSASTQPKVDE